MMARASPTTRWPKSVPALAHGCAQQRRCAQELNPRAAPKAVPARGSQWQTPASHSARCRRSHGLSSATGRLAASSKCASAPPPPPVKKFKQGGACRDWCVKKSERRPDAAGRVAARACSAAQPSSPAQVRRSGCKQGSQTRARSRTQMVSRRRTAQPPARASAPAARLRT